MDIRNRRELKAAARESLANAPYDPRKLVLIHTLAAVLFALAVTVLDYILGDRIAGTGGLGGLGQRTVLSTLQSALRLANLVLLPFWEVGYIYAAMGIARGRETRPDSLLEGLRRWGIVLRSNLLQIMLYLAMGMACNYFAMAIFLATPLSNSLVTLVSPYLNDPSPLLTDPVLTVQVMQAAIPMFVIFLILYAILALPMVYHFRLINYALLDNPKAGAFAALRRSKYLMHGDRFNLFKLDLSFWWFYGAQALLSIICYGEWLLEMLGVPLPFSGNTAFFLFYILSLALQVVLYTFTRNRVAVTYAHAYDALGGSIDEKPAPAPAAPKNQPWQY